MDTIFGYEIIEDKNNPMFKHRFVIYDGTNFDIYHVMYIYYSSKRICNYVYNGDKLCISYLLESINYIEENLTEFLYYLNEIKKWEPTLIDRFYHNRDTELWPIDLLNMI